MAKIRVHELSKQLNISNKDIIDTLGAKGIEIKSHIHFIIPACSYF